MFRAQARLNTTRYYRGLPVPHVHCNNALLGGSRGGQGGDGRGATVPCGDLRLNAVLQQSLAREVLCCLMLRAVQHLAQCMPVEGLVTDNEMPHVGGAPASALSGHHRFSTTTGQPISESQVFPLPSPVQQP